MERLSWESGGRKLRLAFLTSTDPNDKTSWSGIHYSMAKALNAHCGEVSFLGPVASRASLVGRCINKFSSSLFKTRYNSNHSFISAQNYARIFGNKLKNSGFDLVFAPASSTEIALLRTNIPIVYLSDATFCKLTNYYSNFSNLNAMSLLEGNLIEKLAITKSKAVIYSSRWAAESAMNDYRAEKNKIHIIPFGANLETVPSLEKLRQKKRSTVCKLLFLGTHWERKGGDIALETLFELERMGFKVELTVCGCVPPNHIAHRFMKVVPFLNKNDATHRKKLNDLLLEASFLFLPTRSDCSPIVFSEANACGVPVITTDTGGVSSVIKSGENGFTLPTDARGTEYARLIKKIYTNQNLYSHLVRTSRTTFEQKLNWDAWAVSVKKVIMQVLENRSEVSTAR